MSGEKRVTTERGFTSFRVKGNTAPKSLAKWVK